VQGESRVLPSSDNPERFVAGEVLYGRPERRGLAGARLSEQVRLTIRSVRGESEFPIVAFEEVGDRDAAEALRGYVLEVPGSELPDLGDDEFYPFDLIGLEVRDESGVRWGRVTDAVETPAHALLVVLSDAGSAPEDALTVREVLVPFVTEAVPDVCVAEGHLTIVRRFLEQEQ
jgi:16S rRNA processing protein RimM